jgi:hypothetical protein
MPFHLLIHLRRGLTFCAALWSAFVGFEDLFLQKKNYLYHVPAEFRHQLLGNRLLFELVSEIGENYSLLKNSHGNGKIVFLCFPTYNLCISIFLATFFCEIWQVIILLLRIHKKFLKKEVSCFKICAGPMKYYITERIIVLAPIVHCTLYMYIT